MRIRSLCAALAALFAITAFPACSGNGYPSESQKPVSSDTASEIPEYMQTLNPADFEIGEDGFFEDKYLSAYWVKGMKLDGIRLNYVQYSCIAEDGKRLRFSYVRDSGGSFEKELEGYDFASYQGYLKSELNTYYILKEFDYVKQDGHRGIRAMYEYAPPDESGKVVKVLQYAFNVEGWILNLTFTTQGEIPAACDESIRTIDFK